MCNYSNAYIFVEGSITVPNIAVTDADANNINIKIILKNYAPLEKFATKTNNTQADNAQDNNVTISMYNLLENSNNYSNTSESLYQYCIVNNVALTNDNTSNSDSKKNNRQNK